MQSRIKVIAVFRGRVLVGLYGLTFKFKPKFKFKLPGRNWFSSAELVDDESSVINLTLARFAFLVSLRFRFSHLDFSMLAFFSRLRVAFLGFRCGMSRFLERNVLTRFLSGSQSAESADLRGFADKNRRNNFRLYTQPFMM